MQPTPMGSRRVSLCACACVRLCHSFTLPAVPPSLIVEQDVIWCIVSELGER